MSSKPIKPEKVIELKQNVTTEIPEWVIEVVNTFILKYYSANTKTSIFEQNELVDALTEARCNQLGLTNLSSEKKYEIRSQIFHKRFLDFENLYVNEGWKVEYHKTFREEPYWIFSI